jgi:hypothetical protein
VTTAIMWERHAMEMRTQGDGEGSIAPAPEAARHARLP